MEQKNSAAQEHFTKFNWNVWLLSVFCLLLESRNNIWHQPDISLVSLKNYFQVRVNTKWTIYFFEYHRVVLPINSFGIDRFPHPYTVFLDLLMSSPDLLPQPLFVSAPCKLSSPRYKISSNLH